MSSELTKLHTVLRVGGFAMIVSLPDTKINNHSFPSESGL